MLQRILLTIFILLSFGLFAQEIDDFTIKAQDIDPDNKSITWEITLDLPTDLYQQVGSEFLTFTPKGSNFLLKKEQFPEANFKKEGALYYKNRITFTSTWILLDEEWPSEIKGELGYQLCNEDGVCFFPAKEEITYSLNTSGSSTTGLGRILFYFALALVGGLLLNLMPCVFPLLSVKALALVNQQDLKPKDIVKQGLLYTFGILATFWSLAFIVAILQSTGYIVGWGFQFQNAAFVFTLSFLIFLFALSLYDVYIIQLPGLGKLGASSSAKGNLGAFLSGIFAVLIATPCTAPFMGSALAFSFSQPAAVNFSIFTALGIGLSLPYLILSFFPKTIKLLPKPGVWMENFKQFLGFLLIGTSIYLLSTLSQLIKQKAFIGVLYFFLAGGLAAWIWGKNVTPRHGLRRKIITSILLLALLTSSGLYFLDFSTEPTTGISRETADLREGWFSYSREDFERLREENKPVFLDFYASWCTNCKINEVNVLYTKKADQLFKASGVIPMKADFTRYDQEIAKHLQELGKVGLPVYALFLPDREEPVFLPEILTLGTLENHLFLDR